MKILIYSMNFSPELAGVGKYSGEMATWLSAQGHDVRVIAAPPYFPQWSTFSGHSPWCYSRKQWNGMTVYRAPTWIPSQPGAGARLLHLMSFMLSSIPLLLMQAHWKPDLVFVVEPPLFCAPAVLAFSRLLGVKSWLHIQDHELDAAFSMGLLRGERARKIATSIERRILNGFSRVSSISTHMLASARSKGAAAARLVLLPNWVDVAAIFPLSRVSGFRSQLRIPESAVVVLYSGSMGRKQGLELLAEVSHLLSDRPEIHFVFCGNGPTRDDLITQCGQLSRVHFLDLQPQEKLNELLGLADIHVLPQRAEAADLVMPSKLAGMLASGKAVLVTAHAETELGRIVSRCGLVVPPGNASLLAAALGQLALSLPLRELLGAAGRLYAEGELRQDAILRRMEGEMLRCIAD